MSGFPFAVSAFGGVLIGLSAALLLLSHGKIAGISGIAGGLLGGAQRGDRAWRAAFLIGLIGTGSVLGSLFPEAFLVDLPRSTGALLLAGLLVGLGTRFGNGCTSGHGVCGISRVSPRSIVATAVFMLTGVLTVVAARALGVAS